MTSETQTPNAEQQAAGILSIKKVTKTPDVGASGTVTDTGVAAQPAAPVAEVVAPVVAKKDGVLSSTPLELARKEATPLGTMVIDQILAYIDAMAPKKILDVPTTVRWQVSLYRSLTTAINKLDDDFFLVWRAILAAFQEHKDGVLHESAVFRGMPHITLPANDIAAFQRLLNLIRLTADPKGRTAALKQVEMTKTLEHGVTEAGRSRVLNFYNV